MDGIETRGDGAVIKARVRAVPEDGKANAALEKLVATWLDMPQRSVTLASGGKSRVKTIAIAGVSAQVLAAIETALSSIKTS